MSIEHWENMKYIVTTPCMTKWQGSPKMVTVSMMVEQDSTEDAVDYAHYLLTQIRDLDAGYGCVTRIKEDKT